MEQKGTAMGMELPNGRTLHLVDLENLLGDQRRERCAVDGFRHYLELARWSPGDQVIVASHPEIVGQIGFAHPVPCNLDATVGNDAADVMLLSLAPVELVARRYTRLVIGSGDGIFLARARAARALGVGVLVVAREDCVAARFARWGLPVLHFGDVLRDMAALAA
jgi:hypothetical protein